MSTRRLLPALMLCALAVLIAAPAEAQSRSRSRRKPVERGFELSFYFTQTDFDSKSEIDDDLGIGFRFGYLFTARHQLDFLVNAVDTHDAFLAQNQVDMTNFQVAYVYNFTSKDVIPYVTAGIGVVDWHDDFRGNESDGVLGLGAGIRFVAGEAFFLRLEARHNMFEGDNPVFLRGEDFSFNEFAFGLGWRFRSY